MQLRACRENIRMLHDAMAREFWDRLPLANRLNYCAASAPGTALAEGGDGIPKALKGPSVTAEDLECGYANFAAVACEVDVFDWLWLGSEGSRRATVRWTGEKYSAIWLVP